MCGIYFLFKGNKSLPTFQHTKLLNRGPDFTNVVDTNEFHAAFYRLAIVGYENGMQPFESDSVVMLCNGEIYNYKELIEKYQLPVTTDSDCECILHLYKKLGIEQTIAILDGEFAFVIYDKVAKLLHFARDRLGRKPLYTGFLSEQLEIASLYSCLSLPNKYQVVPGLIYTYDVAHSTCSTMRYHYFTYNPNDNITNDMLYDNFCSAVRKRITQSERPVGFLLSGGFDSSLVLSIALKYKMTKTIPHVFTIGFDENAPDVKSATIMVDYLRRLYGIDCIIWHKVILPIQDGLNAIPDVIRILETYDTTTIRASTPMYLISQYIVKNTDVKVILSGEGSDELFGGYLYFRYAPNNQAFRSEICKLLNNLYLYDVLRADRTTANFGLEVRPPFLDDMFVRNVLSSKALTKSETTTKSLIRTIMINKNVLPDSILLGKKEAFSDAVGLIWKDAIAKHANGILDTLDNSKDLSPHLTPVTAEEYWYQTLFAKYYPNSWTLLKELWLPNQAWVKTGREPSARVLGVYSKLTTSIN